MLVKAFSCVEEIPPYGRKVLCISMGCDALLPIPLL
jgi:hypothetical protein